MSQQTPPQKWSVGPGPVAEGSAATPRSSTDAEARAAERACPECGEMVRRGLLRCWNCGAFMEASTQAKYQQMQANPAPLVFSQVPAEELVSVDAGEDDDFELNPLEAAPAPQKTDLGGLEAASPSAQEGRAAPAEGAEQTPHSVATGGDVLLQVALLQEAESKLRRRRRPLMTGGAKTPGGFIIFCPYGCRIEVKEQHRGMNGRCPRCQAPFVVPVNPPNYAAAPTKKAPDAAGGAAGAAAAPGGFVHWLEDLHVHTVPPEKLKLKADSLTRDFAEADFGFGSQGMLIVSLMKKAGGLFGGGGDKKKGETRAGMLQHLADNKPLTDLPVGEQRLVPADQLRQLRVVQPAASRTDSLFQGVPVFGAGRIAVAVPVADDAPPQYVSLGITQFRKLALALAELYGIENFGGECGIPVEDEYEDQGKCHYLGVPVRGLKNIEFYRADPTCEVVVAGWKCAACSLTISEDAREKEKLGGKGGKGIAKAKCPKCQQKFGEKPIYALKQGAAHPGMVPESDSPGPAAPAATAAEAGKRA